MLEMYVFFFLSSFLKMLTSLHPDFSGGIGGFHCAQFSPDGKSLFAAHATTEAFRSDGICMQIYFNFNLQPDLSLSKCFAIFLVF